MSKRDELLTSCRYYKGEKENPYESGSEALFWEYEKKWIELSIQHDDYLGDMLNDYIAYGLEKFEKMDGTPITLKALLFNRHGHWCGGYGLDEDVKNFKEFYLNEYKKEA